MRVSSERLEKVFEFMQACPGEADDLTALVKEVDALHPCRADNHNVAVVLVAIGRRPTCKAGIRGLHDDDLTGGGANLQDAPLLDQGSGANDSQCWSVAEAKAFAEPGASLTATSTRGACRQP